MGNDLILFGAALVGGMMNSLAGGGTLVTFPTLILVGLDPRMANATSALALWPASLGAAWGFRTHLRGSGTMLRVLGPVSVLGGAGGAALLLLTPSAVFARMVPVLILFATLLFAGGDRLQRRGPGPAHARWAGAVALWLLASLYGGYFGAGMGILMLATLGLLGVRDIHRANGVKNLLGAAVNGVAITYFAVTGLVVWRLALIMAGGAVVGGYGASRVAQRLGRRFVRRLVVAVGCVIGAVMLWRQL